MMEKEVGQKIRNLRNAKSITLDVMARRTGLTTGYLSKIERGLNNPPIATLSRIAAALGIKVSDIFEDFDVDTKLSIVGRDERRPITRDGKLFGYYYEALAYRKHNKLMEPFVITLIPNATDKNMFVHDGEEMMFVLKGTMEFVYGEERHIINEGGCVYFDSSVPHRGQCAGDSEAKVLVVISSQPVPNGRL